MPNVTVTPAQMYWAGGSASTIPGLVEIVGAKLRWLGGQITAQPGVAISGAVTAPALDRLRRFEAIVQGSNPTVRFQTIWQQTMEAIEAAFGALTGQVGDLSSIVAQLQATQELAQAANDKAEATRQAASLTDSYVSPASVLTASNSGTVTIAAHERVYGDGTRVSVDGGTLAGFAEGDFVRAFYVDAAREGGAVSYQGTTSNIAQQGDVHVVGGVSIPAAGEVDNPGSGPVAPGYVPDPSQYFNRGEYVIP